MLKLSLGLNGQCGRKSQVWVLARPFPCVLDFSQPWFRRVRKPSWRESWEQVGACC